MAGKVLDKKIDKNGCYISHRPQCRIPVRHLKSDRCLKGVSNGSGPSMSDCLIKRLNLIEFIPDTVGRFMVHNIGLSVDIEKDFLQLSIAPENRDFPRFFFPSKAEELTIY